MAITPLNVFRTVRWPVTTTNVGIYTAPANVASIVLSAQVANVSSGIQTVSAFHYRAAVGSDTYGSVAIASSIRVPVEDTLSLIDGKMVMETDDEFRVLGTADGTMELILSILETAKQ